MDSSQIRSEPAPTCHLCGTPGEVLYAGLRDRSFAAPGEWGLRKCPRAECGLAWLDPRPVPEEIGKAYTGYYTHSQPEPGASWLRDSVWAIWRSYLGVRFGYRRRADPAWRRMLSPLALLHPGGRDELDSAAMYLSAPTGPARLLDVGCGSGVLLARMQSLGWDVEGVEVDAAAVAAARQRGVAVRLGTLEEQRFPDASFDAVHSSHVIEHVHEPVGLLRECLRILKPRGRLVILTPNIESWGHCFFGPAWLNLDPPRHLFLFNSANLRRAAEEVGFVLETFRSTPRTGWVYGALSRQIQRTGRGEMGDLGKVGCLAYGILYQLRQRLILLSRPTVGDELLLIARKPPGS